MTKLEILIKASSIQHCFKVNIYDHVHLNIDTQRHIYPLYICIPYRCYINETKKILSNECPNKLRCAYPTYEF